MRIPYYPGVGECIGHYCDLQKGGSLPVYVGARYQRGSGLGSFLGGIFRSAVPFLKQGLIGVGRYGLNRGLRFIDDVESGKSARDAAIQQVLQTERDLLNNIGATDQTGGGRARAAVKRNTGAVLHQLTIGGGGASKKRKPAATAPKRKRKPAAKKKKPAAPRKKKKAAAPKKKRKTAVAKRKAAATTKKTRKTTKKKKNSCCYKKPIGRVDVFGNA